MKKEKLVIELLKYMNSGIEYHGISQNKLRIAPFDFTPPDSKFLIAVMNKCKVPVEDVLIALNTALSRGYVEQATADNPYRCIMLTESGQNLLLEKRKEKGWFGKLIEHRLVVGAIGAIIGSFITYYLSKL